VLPLSLILAASQGAAPTSFSPDEVMAGVARGATASALAFLVYRLVRRLPWPRPFRLRFAAVHVVSALLTASAWLLLASAGEALARGKSFESVRDRWPVVGWVWVPDRGGEIILLGVIGYAVVAGVSYAVEGSARVARAEALAARTQLAALRAQVHPHFLFNALHTVVQLIPVEPSRAAEAAELVGELLRTTLEERRDEVPLGEEWRFVSRYLAVERMRFGDRLVVREELAAGLLDAHVPAFALQTLVENAVQHGAGPRVGATEIVVAAAGGASELTLSVRNTGDGASARAVKVGPGTGLARLRERLTVLYGSAARLTCGPTADGGFEAVLVVPRHRGGEA
jgi:hypothetical protein